MEIDVVSRNEYERLERRHNLLLNYLGLEEIHCTHPDVPRPKTPKWTSRELQSKCTQCDYDGYFLRKKDSGSC